jgi:ribosomal protein L37AE/L43A
MTTPDCPHCKSGNVERDGAMWVCNCCARKFPALTENDHTFLEKIRVAAD